MKKLVFALVAAIIVVVAAPAIAAEKKLAVLELAVAPAVQVSDYELRTLTDKVREAALQALPPSQYLIMTRENILEILPPGKTLADCAGSCEVEAGRLVGADVVVSGEVGYFGNQLQVNLKMHETAKGRLLGAETIQGHDVAGLAEALKERAALMLAKLRGVATTEREFGQHPEAWDLPGADVVVLKFESEPSGAMVEVDGVPLGETPFAKALPVGPKAIAMKKVNYLPGQTSLNVKKGMEPVVRLSLTPNFGWLTVHSDPPGLPVTINGESAGTTPIESRVYPPGAYKVLVSDPDYYDKGKEFTLDRGQREVVDFKLEHRMGGLEVSATDAKGNDLAGKVYLGEQFLGEVPGRWKVPTGKCEVRIVTELGDWSGKVEVKEREVAAVAAMIQPTLGSLLVQVYPSDARVRVTGLPDPSEPGAERWRDVPAGTYRVTVSRKGYDDYTTTAAVNPGKETTVSATLRATTPRSIRSTSISERRPGYLGLVGVGFGLGAVLGGLSLVPRIGETESDAMVASDREKILKANDPQAAYEKYKKERAQAGVNTRLGLYISSGILAGVGLLGTILYLAHTKSTVIGTAELRPDNLDFGVDSQGRFRISIGLRAF